MRLFILILALFVSACANRPERPDELPVAPSPATPSPHVRSEILGLTAGELVQRFGTPTLQIREGVGLKLQFRGRGCILDAYLYPPPQGQGPDRVTHVDARLQSGADTNQASCIAALQGA